MALIRDRRCECSHEYDVMVLPRRGIEVLMGDDDTEYPEDGAPCPECGSHEWAPVVGVPRGIDLGGDAGVGRVYPYFDRGLGCWVSNAAQRKRICRERNYIPLEGEDVDWERAASQQLDREQAPLRRHRRLLKEQMDDPDIRKAMDLMRRKAADRLKEGKHAADPTRTSY